MGCRPLSLLHRPVVLRKHDARHSCRRGQVTEALPGRANRLVANIGDKEALGGYVKVKEWNDYEIIARGGVMMHIMNGPLMAIFIADNTDSVNNQPGFIGFGIESRAMQDFSA